MKNNIINTFSFLRGHYKKYFIGIVGLTTIRTTATLIQAFMLYYVLNTTALQDTHNIIKTILLLAAYIILLMVLLPVFQFWFNGNAKYGFGNLNKAIYRKLQRMPLDYFKKNHSGKIMSYFLNDAWVVAGILMRHFRRIISALISIVIYLIPMIVIDYKITLIIFVINVLSMIVNIKMTQKVKKLTEEIQENYSGLMTMMSDAVSSMVTIRIYDMTDKIYLLYENKNNKIKELEFRRAGLQNLLNSYNFMVRIAAMGIFLVIGSNLRAAGIMTYGGILALLTLQKGLDSNFCELGEYLLHLNSSLAAADRLYKFLELPEEEQDGFIKAGQNHTESNEIIKKESAESVEFNNVSFGYTEEYVIKNFNFSVKKGECIAITGESGCGKSTIAKLLMGFYPVNDGEIQINNKNIFKMSKEELRSKIAYIPQEPMMYNETIYENIRYGNHMAGKKEIINAAKQAGAYDFIMMQPQGFDTCMGENGSRLSGGQLQRIALARAIIKNSDILILDEATASLDNESEKIVLESIRTLQKDKVIISIAHKSTVISAADREVQIIQKTGEHGNG